MEPGSGALYDEIGVGYRHARQPDPRIAAQIHRALGDAVSVVNVGAGVGSYEPNDRPVVAVEPSQEMIAQRPPASAPAVRARAESLPFADGTFGAAMGVLTLHHWSDIARGLAEAQRVAGGRVVFLTWMAPYEDFWLLDYVPAVADLDEELFPDEAALTDMLGPVQVEPVLIPADCSDGFMCAYWRRPEAYLDPVLRRSISTFAKMRDYEHGIERLAADLESGAWHRRYARFLECDEMDFGYRLVSAPPR